MTIDPVQMGIITINCLPQSLGHIQDMMVLISEDLPEGIHVSLTAFGVEGFVLSGNLSGTYPSATYRITGDLFIEYDETVNLLPGTRLLFDGEYELTIEGILIAQGTGEDQGRNQTAP